MTIGLRFTNQDSIRGSNMSYRAWFQSDERTKVMIQKVFLNFCEYIVTAPALNNGTHPQFADVMRCVITNGQDLATLKQGDYLPKPMRTICPEVTVYVRKTPTAFQVVLRIEKTIDWRQRRMEQKEVVIREQLRPLHIEPDNTSLHVDRAGWRALLARIFTGV